MNRFSEGNSFPMFCKNCRKSVNSIVVQRSLPIENGHGLIKNALLVACDECDEIIGIPPQSETAVRSALDLMNGESHVIIEANSLKSCKKPSSQKEYKQKKYVKTTIQLKTLEDGNMRIANE